MRERLKIMILQTGKIVSTYSPDGSYQRLAVLIEKDEDPDLDDLMNPSDISKPVENTKLERWKVRFVGDPPNHTYMRWIDPRFCNPPSGGENEQ